MSIENESYDDWKESDPYIKIDEDCYDESEVAEMIRLVEKYQQYGFCSIGTIIDHKKTRAYKEHRG